VIKDLNVPKLQSFSNSIVQQAINLMREPYLNFRCIFTNTHIHSHTKRYNNIYYNRVINKVTLSFTPYPLFQWYPQTNEILLNLSMKCRNSAFNAQGSKVIIMAVQVGAVKIYVAAVEALRKKRKVRMKLNLPPKLVGKLVWVPVILFCKIFIPSHAFDALLCRNCPFSPPNRLTLRLTSI
jgi:hypothetical protein